MTSSTRTVTATLAIVFATVAGWPQIAKCCDKCNELLQHVRESEKTQDAQHRLQEYSSLEQKSEEELKQEAIKASLNVVIYDVPIGAGGGSSESRQRKSAYLKAFAQKLEQDLAQVREVTKPNKDALNAWVRCLELCYGSKSGLNLTVLEERGGVIKFAVQYVNEHPGAQVKITSVASDGYSGVEAIKVGNDLHQPRPSEYVVRRTKPDAYLVIYTDHAGAASLPLGIGDGPDRDKVWANQVAEAFSHGADAVASQGIFSDKIVVKWRRNPEAFRYDVSCGDTSDFARIPKGQPGGPKYFWLRSDQPELAAKENVEFRDLELIWRPKPDDIQPGKIYYFFVEWERRETDANGKPREGGPGYTGNPGEYRYAQQFHFGGTFAPK